MTINKQKDKAGFTLIEMLVVLAVIAILMSMLILWLMGVKDEPKKKSSLAGANTLKTRIDGYGVITGGILPIPDMNHINADGIYNATNAEIVEILRNPIKTPNGMKDPMLQSSEMQMDANGNIVDAWGEPLVVQIMTKDAYDAACKAVREGTASPLQKYWCKTVRGEINIYSTGPNKIDEMGYKISDLDSDNDGNVDAPEPPLSGAVGGESLDDLADKNRFDDVRSM